MTAGRLTFRTSLALLTALCVVGCATNGSAKRPAGSDAEVETGFLNRTLVLDGGTFRYQIYVPADYTPERPWPVILALHGSGERGTDGLLQTEVGLGTALRRHSPRWPAIVVFPQVPPRMRWTGAGADIAMKALEQAERDFNVDPDRVYLTGLSMGGSGTWHVAYRHPNRFAALLVICGRVNLGGEATVPLVPESDGPVFSALARQLKHIPTWIFHGDSDNVVPVEESRRIYEALQRVGAPVRYSELPGVNHNAWDTAYGSPEVAEWLLAQRRLPQQK